MITNNKCSKMKTYFKLFIIILFQISTLYCWGKGKYVSVSKESDTEKKETTMVVDTDITPAGKSPEELEKEKQDSIKRVNEKWKNYLSERNNEMQQLYDAIQQIDSNVITKEDIGNYLIEVNKLKEKIDFKLSNEVLWKDNDELDELRLSFFDLHARALQKLNYWEEKLNQKKEPVNKLLILGICLMAVMAAVPIFTQVKSALMMKKMKKQQAQLAKQQQEEAEKKMLLSDENMTTLKE